jgi:hypothetical protein
VRAILDAAGLSYVRIFAFYRSKDEYDSNAIIHVMACSSLVPGRLISQGRGEMEDALRPEASCGVGVPPVGLR